MVKNVLKYFMYSTIVFSLTYCLVHKLLFQIEIRFYYELSIFFSYYKYMMYCCTNVSLLKLNRPLGHYFSVLNTYLKFYFPLR